jgi:hypothetical protein
LGERARVVVKNLMFAGRYSHAMTMVGSKLLIVRRGHVAMSNIWALALKSRMTIH